MIKTTSGRSLPRTIFWTLEYYQRRFIDHIGLNARVIDDLFETIWHESLAPDSQSIRINVSLPIEVHKQCKKINERRRKPDQRKSDIEAAIVEWANGNGVYPSHAVFIGPSAVLFFNNENKAVVAHLFMSDQILEFKERR